MTIDPNRKYAAVSMGGVVRYPVPHLEITEEDLTSGRVKVVQTQDTIPTTDKFTKLKLVVEIVGIEVHEVYQETPKTTEEFVEEFYLEPLKPYLGEPTLDVNTIPASVIASMVAAIRDLGTMQLNRFAAEKGYDDINTLVSYRNDPFADFAAEAERAFVLRSQYWSVFSIFNKQIAAGEIEFPRTADGITAMFPELTWE